MWVLGLRKGPWAPGAAVKGLAVAWTAPGAERWETRMRLSGHRVSLGLQMGNLRPQKGWPDSPVAVKREVAGWESSWPVGRAP